MTSILKKLSYLFFFSLLSLSSLFAQYPFGQLEGQVSAITPNGSGTAFVDLDPLVTYHFSADSSHTTTFSDSVKLLWLFSDGTYSLERTPNHPFDQTNLKQDMTAYLKSNARYKPTDPIRFEIPSRSSDSYQRVKVDTLDTDKNIRIQSSWQPISGDTIYYVITLENDAQQCEKQPINGLVRFSFPSDTLQILEEIIYQNRFQPTHAVYPTNSSPLEYNFSNMPHNDQWYLIIKALVADGLALGEQYSVEAMVEMVTPNQEFGSTNNCGSDSDNDLVSTTNRPKDPNNKLVDREVIYTDQGQQKLLFTINFQNIKGGNANKVKIFDYFDFAHLDTTGFEIVAKSHEVSPTWQPDGLQFTFKTINLSSVEAEKQKAAPNLDATKGFVTYRVAVKSPYQVGDVIENQAAVEFFHVSDALNPADKVVTNKTTTLVKALSSHSTECTPACATFSCCCTIILILSVVVLLLLLLIFVKKLR